MTDETDDSDDLRAGLRGFGWGDHIIDALESDPIGILRTNQNIRGSASPTMRSMTTPQGRPPEMERMFEQSLPDHLITADMSQLETRVAAHIQQQIDDEINGMINDETIRGTDSEVSAQAEGLRRAMATVGQSTISAAEAMRQLGRIGVDLAAGPDSTVTLSGINPEAYRALEEQVAELDLIVSQQRLAIAELQVENKQLKDSVRTILKGKHPQQRRVKINRKKGHQ